MGARKYATVAAALVVFFAAVHSAPQASSQEPLDYSPYQRVLARCVDSERFVDYAEHKREAVGKLESFNFAEGRKLAEREKESLQFPLQ